MTLAVYYSELGVKEGGSSPTGSVGWKGGQAETRTFRVKWGDRWTARKQLVGYSYPYTSGSRFLRRELPEGHPMDTTLFCTTARIVRGEKWTGRSAYDPTTRVILPGYPNKTATKSNDGDAAGLPQDALFKVNEFKWAVIEANYTAADFYIRTDADIDGTYAGSELARFTSYRDDRQVKGLTIQGGILYWILPGHPAESIPFGVPKIEFEKTVYVKWHQVAIDAVPLTTIDNMIAKVNKTTFLTVYPPDSLIMMPPRIDRYVMANGLIGCDIEFCYGYTPNLQPKLLYAKSGVALGYKWVTTNSAAVADPTPGALPADQFLFNEAEFLDCYLPANP